MKIKEYQTSNGVSPFNKWYKKIGNTLQVKVDARLQRIIVTSNFGDTKPITKEIFELRFLSKSGLRIYYTKDGEDIILLLVGGNKSTQKRDIVKAKEYLNDYKVRGDDYGQ